MRPPLGVWLSLVLSASASGQARLALPAPAAFVLPPVHVQAVVPATPVDGWAARFDFIPARAFFDGGAPRSDAAAVFAFVERPGGAVRVHLVERAPAAAPRAVPGTEGLSGVPLLDALASVSSRGHRARDYAEASNFLFSRADNVVVNGVRGVVDAYSGIFVPGTSSEGSDYPETGDRNGDGYGDRAGMNVEHTWPQSLFHRDLPMRSDLHHLMATFQHPNSVRGSLPFGVVDGETDYRNAAGAKRGGGVFEPPDAVKGRVARGLLYFYARYGSSRGFTRASAAFWNRQIELLLDWNRRFPPDEFEARRNDMIESFQGNRNPFIDDSSLADRVGADAFRPRRLLGARRMMYHWLLASGGPYERARAARPVPGRPRPLRRSGQVRSL